MMQWHTRARAVGLRVLLASAVLGACRGPRPGAAQEDKLRLLVDSLQPLVEQAVGLKFTKPPRFALRSKEQVKSYLLAKLSEEYPDAKIEGVEAAYRLLELIPDTLKLKPLLLSLYAEQVAGYYDPDSTVLYAVPTDQPEQQRLVLAHEMVHALQHERLPLDTLLHDVTDADRQAASQAVLEGHATLAMIRVVQPDVDIIANPDFWRLYREQVASAQTGMKVFSSAPLVLRESMIFPYLSGAEFMRWWALNHAGSPLPSRAEMPSSTEQILHPARYEKHDQPISVRFREGNDGVLYEDTMGEMEIQVLTAALRGGGEVLTDLPLGWGGDRFRVYRTATGPALVWHTVWDDSASARRFVTGAGQRFAARSRPGYRTTVESESLDGRPAVRVVRAPTGWDRWARLPEAQAQP